MLIITAHTHIVCECRLYVHHAYYITVSQCFVVDPSKKYHPGEDSLFLSVHYAVLTLRAHRHLTRRPTLYR